MKSSHQKTAETLHKAVLRYNNDFKTVLMSISPKRSLFSKVPLSLVLIVPFVTLVVGTVTLVSYLSYQSGQQAIANLANQLLRQTSERVSDRLDTYLQRSQQIVAANQLAVKQGTLNLDDKEQLRQQLWQQILLNPSLPASSFWSEEGTVVGYLRVDSQEVQQLAEKATGKPIPRGSIFFNEVTPNQRRYYTVDPQGKPFQLFLQSNDDFRNITWYKQARAIGKQAWTPISLARVIPTLQTVAVAPVIDTTGKFYGFFTANYLLSDISLFLSQLKFTPTGQIFIIERSGELVATSVAEEASGLKKIDGQVMRLTAIGSQDKLTREVSKQLLQQLDSFDQLKESRQFDLNIEGYRQFVQITPYRDKYGLNWQLVTVIPESDFITEIQENAYRTGLLCISALIVSVGIGIWTSRRIGRSLSYLTKATKSFSEHRLEQPIPNTTITEVQALKEALHQMMVDLRDADQMRLNYQQDLERQVAEKTDALIEAQRIARVGSWELDVKTGLITWSAEIYRILGVDPTADSPRYPNVIDRIIPEDRFRLCTAIDDAITNGTPYSIEYGNFLPDRSICYLLSRGEPVFDEQGKVIKLRGTAQDISDRKQAEIALKQTLKELNYHIENSPLATIRWNHEFRVEYWSSQAELIFGWKSAEVLGKKITDWKFIHEDDQEIVNQDILILMSGIGVTCANRNYHKDGTILYCEWHNSALSDDSGNLISMLSLAQDVTDRKQAEFALAEAKEIAETATKAKSAFLANMSHEIRTPMNGVIGMTQLLETTDLTEEQADFVKTIKDSGETLLTVINDILDFSKIESGRLEIEEWEFVLEDVVSGVCKLLETQAKNKNIRLQYAIAPVVPDIVISDYSRLRQILLNLVGNAVKFTHQGQVSILVSGTPLGFQTSFPEAKKDKSLDSPESKELGLKDRYQLKFTIADTGIGIKGDRLNHLFQPFTQADASVSRKFGGTGLGLAISKRLVDLMHGTIWVESCGQVGGYPPAGWQPLLEPQGSTFHFEIVVSTSEKIKQPLDSSIKKVAIDKQIAEKLPLKILLVEDNQVNQMVVCSLLKKLGYEVADIANNGLEAVQAVKDHNYDLVLMDLQMPEMDGLTATKIIRTELMSQVRIVAMTADVLPDDRQACVDVGMNDYVSKPINIEEIMRVISSQKNYLPTNHPNSQKYDDTFTNWDK
ncbi:MULTISPECIES: PAS domain-containing protein [Pseudanabaena]|uniref:PAS domain-containing protein n=1 Tax=Pseudanabaena TaxID=1152 RepID=UPI002479DB07|nr:MULTISPECIES: PAS domain-containing protein [Pseudanabaena]WGS70796.1 response regulator [Pseudanabaena galeata CCNP1313]